MSGRVFVGWGFVLAGLLFSPIEAGAQLADTASFLAHVSNEYRVVPNVTYHVASDTENKLDLYLPTQRDRRDARRHVYPWGRLGWGHQREQRATAVAVSGDGVGCRQR